MSEEAVEAEVVEEVEEKSEASVEELATRMGWRPDGGDKTAVEFLEDTVSYNNSLRKRVDRLTSQVDKLVTSSTKQTMSALREQRARLEREFEEAVESGDKVAARRATEEMKAIDSQPVDESRNDWQEKANEFVAAHEGVLKDPLAAAEARSLISQMYEQGFGPDDTYAAVDRKLRKEFPEHYANQNRARPPKVGGESRPQVTSKGAWGKLVKEEPEAEKAFMDYVEMGVYKDTKEHREKFAKLAMEA